MGGIPPIIFKEVNKMGVNWNDATDRTEIPFEEIMKSPTNKYLTNRTTYGKVIKEDEFGIIILTDKDEANLCEITVIPKPWTIVEKDSK